MVADLLNDSDPKTMAEYKQRSDWIKWKEAIEAELDSLRKREVFSNVIPTPPRIHPVEFKWVFSRKRNENNKVVRYKARLVAQGFTQRPDIDFNETYSPVMNGINFQYLISLATQKCDRTPMNKQGFVSQDSTGGFSMKRECANRHISIQYYDIQVIKQLLHIKCHVL
jgi:hypothetical protein